MSKEAFIDGLKYTEEERLARDVRKMSTKNVGIRRGSRQRLLNKSRRQIIRSGSLR
jgi:hypothetical protein